MHIYSLLAQVHTARYALWYLNGNPWIGLSLIYQFFSSLEGNGFSMRKDDSPDTNPIHTAIYILVFPLESFLSKLEISLANHQYSESRQNLYRISWHFSPNVNCILFSMAKSGLTGSCTGNRICHQLNHTNPEMTYSWHILWDSHPRQRPQPALDRCSQYGVCLRGRRA